MSPDWEVSGCGVSCLATAKKGALLQRQEEVVRGWREVGRTGGGGKQGQRLSPAALLPVAAVVPACLRCLCRPTQPTHCGDEKWH
ncbi:hypothetical protein EYF80_020729 [Liparis tanakae]|uniref:Uncharacterized protein n=1 Tax=Liparis tanakae TaxID=230148 RepID=A0A4Z2HT44_9TELE|nr:hypothetical protein EYF80_020729 [Liparis tanakae]